jgi:dihydrofolate synthase / folylpolyglutamate synthase
MIADSNGIIERLFRRTRHGIKLGLDRMLAASADAGNPHRAYRSIHVAGTNGKGSTCAFMESCLRTFGFQTGLFTSPHLVRFEERFIMNGQPVAADSWLEVYADMDRIIERYDLTFFEAVTLTAFELFRRSGVEWAVFETGMGGRLDATNIIDPEVSVITSISMDHAEYLGNNLLSIAGEKLGIVKNEVPLIMIKPPQEEIAALAVSVCADKSTECFFVDGNDIASYNANKDNASFLYKNTEITTNLRGKFQALNAITAYSALKRAGFSDDGLIVDGIKNTFIPGRFQVIELKGHFVVFDAGHNPGAAEVLVSALRDRFAGFPLCIVTGIMKDKDISGIFKSYCSIASRLILTSPETSRAASVECLLQHVPADFRGKCESIADVGTAVSTALARNYEKAICITGSFFTVGEAMSSLGVEPYRFYPSN